MTDGKPSASFEDRVYSDQIVVAEGSLDGSMKGFRGETKCLVLFENFTKMVMTYPAASKSVKALKHFGGKRPLVEFHADINTPEFEGTAISWVLCMMRPSHIGKQPSSIEPSELLKMSLDVVWSKLAISMNCGRWLFDMLPRHLPSAIGTNSMSMAMILKVFKFPLLHLSTKNPVFLKPSLVQRP